LKIGVTGGAGFIGSHLVDSLIRDGHRVAVIDNLSMGRLNQVNDKAAFYLMDIRHDEIGKIFDLESFDVIYHLAAQMDIRVSVSDPVYDARVNILGLLNLLQHCVRTRVRRFIFASTGGAIYGEQEAFPCDESHPTRPVSPYGIAKLTSEKYLYYYLKEFGLEHVILRYANVYGPRQNPRGEAGVVAIFAHKLLSGENPVINGDGRQTRDYVFVDDVVNANLSALHYSECETFNIGTGNETDVNELFKQINHLTGNQFSENHGPAKPGEQKRSAIDGSKASLKMQWTPRTDLAQGLKKTIDYFKSWKP